MPYSLQQAFEAFKAARAISIQKKEARKDAEERAAEAMKEDREAATAMDNARDRLNAVISDLSLPPDDGSRR